MDNRVLPGINLKSRGEKMALEIYLSARDQYLQETEYTKVAKAEKKIKELSMDKKRSTFKKIREIA